MARLEGENLAEVFEQAITQSKDHVEVDAQKRKNGEIADYYGHRRYVKFQ